MSSILPKLIKSNPVLKDIFEKELYSVNDSMTTDMSLRKIICLEQGLETLKTYY